MSFVVSLSLLVGTDNVGTKGDIFTLKIVDLGVEHS